METTKSKMMNDKHAGKNAFLCGQPQALKKSDDGWMLAVKYTIMVCQCWSTLLLSWGARAKGSDGTLWVAQCCAKQSAHQVESKNW